MSKRHHGTDDSLDKAVGHAGSKAETLKAHLIGLNQQFASWVQLQSAGNLDKFWIDGAKDYLEHADNLLRKYKDVLKPDTKTAAPPASYINTPSVAAVASTFSFGPADTAKPTAAFAQTVPTGAFNFLQNSSAPQDLSPSFAPTSASLPSDGRPAVRQRTSPPDAAAISSPTFGSALVFGALPMPGKSLEPSTQPDTTPAAHSTPTGASSGPASTNVFSLQPPVSSTSGDATTGFSFGLQAGGQAAAGSPAGGQATGAADGSVSPAFGVGKPSAAAFGSPAPTSTTFSFGGSAGKAPAPAASSAFGSAPASSTFGFGATAPITSLFPAAANPAPTSFFNFGTKAADATPSTSMAGPASTSATNTTSTAPAAAVFPILSSPAASTSVDFGAKADAAHPGLLGAATSPGSEPATSTTTSPSFFSFSGTSGGFGAPVTSGQSSFLFGGGAAGEAASGAGEGDGDKDPEAPNEQDESAKEPMAVKIDDSMEVLFLAKSKFFHFKKGDDGKVVHDSKGVGNLSLRRPKTSDAKPFISFTTETGRVLFITSLNKSMKVKLIEGGPNVMFAAPWSPDGESIPTIQNVRFQFAKGREVEFKGLVEQLQQQMPDA